VILGPERPEESLFKSRPKYGIQMEEILSSMVIVVGTVIMFGLLATAAPVNASFCIFNCEAQDKLKRHEALADWLRDQLLMGTYGRTAYGTEDLSSDGKEVRIGVIYHTIFVC
jgi:hypothetical protein